MIDQIKHKKHKLSGSVHKSGEPGSGRGKPDISVRADAQAPPGMSDMCASSHMKQNHKGANKARVKRSHGYHQTVFGNEAGR